MAENLYADINSVDDPISITVNTSHGAQTSNAFIEALDTSLDINDEISIDLGYVGNHDTIFTGYVKTIEWNEPERKVTITAVDTLIRAMDYFIVSSTPTNVFTRRNISAENLVRDVLALAGITNYTGSSSGFTFAISNPLEVNITSSYDYCKFVADIIAWHLYADSSGLVHFTDRRPYVMGGDSSYLTITGDIINYTHSKDDSDLRNRVVVYGYGGLSAEASASSPYLPAGFYKSVLVAAPDVIDTQSMANQAASYNLTLLNRLKEGISMQVVGDPAFVARRVITMDTSRTELNGDWYLFAVGHTWNKDGYVCDLELRK